MSAYPWTPWFFSLIGLSAVLFLFVGVFAKSLLVREYGINLALTSSVLLAVYYIVEVVLGGSEDKMHILLSLGVATCSTLAPLIAFIFYLGFKFKHKKDSK